MVFGSRQCPQYSPDQARGFYCSSDKSPEERAPLAVAIATCKRGNDLAPRPPTKDLQSRGDHTALCTPVFVVEQDSFGARCDAERRVNE